MRILVAEDETIIRLDLREILERAGFEVCAEARDGEEAVALAEREKPDLAILDVNLKGESVWPVATALRAKGIPFVLASGGHVEPPPAEFADTPMIEKPYTIDRVSPIIDAALTATG